MIRILIVDDEVKLGKVLGETLTSQGHVVERCALGRAAVERIQQASFDLVITDLRMPDLDGVSVLREVRRLSPNTDVG